MGGRACVKRVRQECARVRRSLLERSGDVSLGSEATLSVLSSSSSSDFEEIVPRLQFLPLLLLRRSLSHALAPV